MNELKAPSGGFFFTRLSLARYDGLVRHYWPTANTLRKSTGEMFHNLNGAMMITKEELINLLRPIFEKNKTKKAILFGSYAKGTQCENSDIDILVDSGLHGLDFFGLLEEICSVVDNPVDLIDVYQLTNDSLIRETQLHGEVIYEQP